MRHVTHNDLCHIHNDLFHTHIMTYVTHYNDVCHTNNDLCLIHNDLCHTHIMTYVIHIMTYVTDMIDICHKHNDLCPTHMIHAQYINEFPAQKCSSIKNVLHQTDSPSDSVHGCRIPPDLADTTCASQERATPRCDFSRIAAGKTIFLHFRCSHEN